MNFASYLVLALIIVWLIAAVVYMLRHKNRCCGKCEGCGSCSGCGSCKGHCAKPKKT